MIDERKISDLTVEEAKELLRKFMENTERPVEDACRKASEWRSAHNQMLTIGNIIDAVEVAQMTLAEDFKEWDEMKDDEKNDLAEMMCGLMVARDMIADMFGLPTKGHIEIG